MAKINDMIPFLLQSEAGIKEADMKLPLEAMFAKAKKTGYADHRLDKGGATQCGVTIGTYTTYRRLKGRPSPTKEELRNISLAEWTDILKTLYWGKWRADEIRSQSVAELLVDWQWASGNVGVKRVQRLLGVTADGVVGPRTVAAINARPARQLFEEVWSLREAHFRGIVAADPSQRIWLNGWLNRLSRIKFKD